MIQIEQDGEKILPGGDDAMVLVERGRAQGHPTKGGAAGLGQAEAFTYLRIQRAVYPCLSFALLYLHRRPGIPTLVQTPPRRRRRKPAPP